MKYIYSWTRIRLLAVVLVVFGSIAILATPTQAARFQDRSLFIGSPTASETTFYQVTFTYPTPSTVGSLRLEFCDNPLPSQPCIVPPGLDITNATLTAQSGETGYTISQQTNSVIVLSRTPGTTTTATSSYRFDNIVNPSDQTQVFYVRMNDYASTDATGSFENYGSISGKLTQSIQVYTQVPPILVFCVASVINDDDCQDTNGSFADYGELSSRQARTATAQILARTNAQYGYSIVVSGKTMTAGTNEIPAASSPVESFPGVGQFGTNLTANSQPAVGDNPVGPGVNAVVNTDYTQPNKYVFRTGDVLVASTGVTPTRKFTSSYIVNIPSSQPPGIYSTTLSYLCLAGF